MACPVFPILKPIIIFVVFTNLELFVLKRELLHDVALGVEEGQHLGQTETLAGHERVGQRLLAEVEPGRGRLRVKVAVLGPLRSHQGGVV